MKFRHKCGLLLISFIQVSISLSAGGGIALKCANTHEKCELSVSTTQT